ncbi:hypothetical protein HU200_009753 [Digitaria exilis]|uniref:NAC domain-containing protein n=1 Tax=Digitaria exilis TaxID=1010633 RepID=A0A835FJK1_9POAL|nr:hypothetical protein HU200_009753 [Digitaria exilis]
MGGHQGQHKNVVGDLKLLPGFRFHPNDDEIIVSYLIPKVHQKNFTCTVIGEINFNKTEPWELPDKAKIGEKEWYFFCQKDRKYPTGIRTNRATEHGYWKATGRDREIYTVTKEATLELVGMKKTLVFYKGRAPQGQKTDWIMHEFRLETTGKVSCPTSSSASTTTTKSSTPEYIIFTQNEWVVCRVFHKPNGIKRDAEPPNSPYMASNEIEQSNMPMPMSMPFPMLSNFTMNPAMSYYSNTGRSFSSMPPVMPSMVGMSSIDLQMNNTMFENPMVMAPSMSYHQTGMEGASTCDFVASSRSGTPSPVSQKDTGMNSDQNNTTKISSMAPATPEFLSTIDIDGIWKY